MMKNRYTALFVATFCILTANIYAGTIVFEDNFDQGTLDNWAITYTAYPTSIATASNPPYDYHFTSSALVVDDIYSTTPYPVSNVLVSQITFTHILPEEVGDYSMTLSFSWTMNSTQDGQQIFLRAVTPDNYTKVGMADMYTHTLGEYGLSEFSGVHSVVYGNVTELTSTASITITRENNILTTYWDAIELDSTTETSPLTSINIDIYNIIKYYTHEGLTFGAFTIDSVYFEGETVSNDIVPEPSTIILMCCSLIAFIKRQFSHD